MLSPAIKASILLSICFVTVFVDGKVIDITESKGGIISSPDYPKAYANDLEVTWNIHVRPGHKIAVYFTEFDLENSYDDVLKQPCVYDYLKVRVLTN